MFKFGNDDYAFVSYSALKDSKRPVHDVYCAYLVELAVEMFENVNEESSVLYATLETGRNQYVVTVYYMYEVV